MLINGQWITSEQREQIAVINPATEEIVGQFPKATAEDVAAAACAAGSRFQKWRSTTPRDRARLLRSAANYLRSDPDPVASMLTLEEGKSLDESRSELESAAKYLEWFAEEGCRAYGRIVNSLDAAGVEFRIRKEPIGPAAIFTPWNFPLGEPAVHVGAAIAAGCSVVLKPSEETPFSGLALARAFTESDAPPGLVNVVVGAPDMIAPLLIEHPTIRKVSFTGSVAVGKYLAGLAGANMKHFTMELGGNAPAIVCDDADIDNAIAEIIAGKFRNAGQVCIAPNRIFVQRGIAEEFERRMVTASQALPIGEGIKAGVKMGPLANHRRVEAMIAFVSDATKKGAQLLSGGSRIGNRGYFWQPTVLGNVGDSTEVANKECFGPIVPMLRFNSIDEVIARANSTATRLASYAFTTSQRTAQRLERGLNFGMVGLNTVWVSSVVMPFGGVQDAGIGKVGGKEGLDEFFTLKVIAHAA